MQSITKFEQIIFKERDIESLKVFVDKWKEYSLGKRDIFAENQYILDDVEKRIVMINKLIEANTPDSKRILNDILEKFYDDHYYAYHTPKECAEKFFDNYAMILRNEARKEHKSNILYYSIDNALTRFTEYTQLLHKEQEELATMIDALNIFEKIWLNYIRNSPTSRINSSPSFIFTYFGEKIANGYADGLSVMEVRKKDGEIL
jgi:hypothetical protein